MFKPDSNIPTYCVNVCNFSCVWHINNWILIYHTAHFVSRTLVFAICVFCKLKKTAKNFFCCHFSLENNYFKLLPSSEYTHLIMGENGWKNHTFGGPDHTTGPEAVIEGRVICFSLIYLPKVFSLPHSSEIRGLCSTKFSSETRQNWYILFICYVNLCR